ncbi:MAG: ubiquitinyl hydrolase 1 [Chrysothrix sp. TS-e1954]|nr:MAG: ubiquitinyl hydrolase 1 [Chrysothrix sp. TS-e1954]
MAKVTYKKHFVPLESDPDVFTGLMHDLGASKMLKFVDIWSMEAQGLETIPRPVLALILVLPTSEIYEQRVTEEESHRDIYKGTCCEEGVMWFRQTINNACGLYALLHAICNNEGEKLSDANSILSNIITDCAHLTPIECAEVIENSVGLERAHFKAAMNGSSEVPHCEADVDYHYICYTKAANGNLYELDGDLKGPVMKGYCFGHEEDILKCGSLEMVKEHIQKEEARNFSLMALVLDPDLCRE